MSAGAALDVLYIAGNGRSGSTLLDRVLGQLPGTISLGEARFLWEFGFVRNHLCECGAPFRECPFWRGVTQAAFGDVSAERARELARQSRRLLWTPASACLRGRLESAALRRLRAEHARLAAELYRAIAAHTGATCLVDSSKLASYGLLLAQVPGIRLHVVHLIRDSRAVAFSWKRRRVKPEVAGGETYMPVRPAALTALRWDAHNLLAQRLGRAAWSYLRVRYEDFVRAPAEALRRIARSAGWVERPDLGFLADGFVTLGRGHTVAGNPLRFQSGVLRLRVDDEWRRGMSRSERWLVTLLTLPQLVAYGYRPLVRRERAVLEAGLGVFGREERHHG